MDDLRKKTDKELQKMEKKLAKIYKEAEKDLTKKWNEYMGRAEKRIEKYEKALSDAKQSGDKESIAQAEEELKRRREAALYKDEWYRKMVEQTAEKYSDVNNIAVAYVNDKMPGIYTMNLNGTLQDINSDLGKVGQLGVSLNLVDEHTVRNLVKSDKSLFPQKVIDKAKDMKWNLKAINSQVTQGILQGESIPQIQKRLQNVTNMNSAAAIRSARTMCTTAENNGRMSGIKEAEEQGIVYEKQWMSTHDERTRESHAELDGESVPIDEEFSNGLQYPGDPNGAPEEVYNCFVGETKVGANSRIIRTYKHKYEGDLFTIKTASGIQFTCTPNHPILTSRGWIAANRINDGDDLFVTSVSKKPFFVTWSNPNINHVLASFDTLHKFFYVLGRKRTTDLGVNFHGDIPTSEVEIVTQKRFLRNNRNTCGGKSINKFFFILADKAAFCKSTFLEHFGRIWQSSFCGIGSKGKPFAFFGRCLRHSKIHSLRPIALLDSGRIQKSYNNGARYAQLLGNSLNGFSGIVFADKVISIDINFSHCDVFNLQSENGYYFASSIIPQRHRKGNNDIMVIAHNCRCSLVRKLIGFRREDGSVSEVGDIKRYEPTYFPKAEPEEKTEKATEEVEDWRSQKAEYTPAKTIEEAESFAKETFVDGGGFNLTGKTVSFKGIDVETANEINSTLNDIYNKFNIDKLSSLESYGKRDKRAYSKNSDAPFFTTNMGNLGINNTIASDMAHLEKYAASGAEAFNYVLANMDVLSGAQLELAKTYKTAGRSLVDSTVNGMVTHEVGHHITYMPDINKAVAEIQKSDTWKEYAQGLSGYANHSFGEYMAESFSAYYKGEEDKVQPELLKIFEGLRKK